MDKVIDFKLEAASQEDRICAWKRLLDENVMGVECTNADDMQASLKVRIVDGGSLNLTRFTRQTLSRTPALIKQAREESMLLVFVKAGRHTIRQGRRSATLDGEGIYCLDGSRPFEVDFCSDDVTQSALHVPKSALTRRVGSLDELSYGPETPLQRLLSTFADGFGQAFQDVDADAFDALLNQTLDLFALMVAQQKSSSIDPSTHRSGTLLRVKAYVNAHLHDDDLSLERTARALGISARYVNALLASEGASFGRYLLAARLEGARREIMDPRRVHRQVTEVAFDWGFRNASHFGRAFREKYGMTPRDAKYTPRDAKYTPRDAKSEER